MFNKREAAAILAGLRLVQVHGLCTPCPWPDIAWDLLERAGCIMTNDGEFKPPAHKEIDALCVRISTMPGPHPAITLLRKLYPVAHDALAYVVEENAQDLASGLAEEPHYLATDENEGLIQDVKYYLKSLRGEVPLDGDSGSKEPHRYAPDVEYDEPTLFECIHCDGVMEEDAMEADQGESRMTWSCARCGAMYIGKWLAP